MLISLKQLEPNALGDLIAGGENQFVSLLEAVPPPRVLAREIGALANGGGGHLILGIRPDGFVQGINLKHASACLEQAVQLLEPHPEITLLAAEMNGKIVAVSEVSPAGTPVFADGVALIRDGILVRPANQARILNLVISRLDGEKVTVEEALQQLARQIEAQTVVIEQLRREAEIAGSWQSQVKGWIYGGLIGAAIGIALSYVF